MFFVTYDMLIARIEAEADLLLVIIVLSCLLLATVLFLWADILGDPIMIKPKYLRILASWTLVLAMLFGSGALFFDVFTPPLGSRINLSWAIIVLLNIIQATVFFFWASLRDGNKR
jgi:hypothetical protein